jgi:hypothetical protein
MEQREIMEQNTAAAERVPTGRRTHIALWTLQTVTAVAVLGAGITTIAGGTQVAAVFDTIGVGDWFRYLTGALQIAGALGLLVPRLCGLAGLALAGLWLSAIGTHLFLIGGNPAPAVVLFVLSAAIAWARRDRISGLLVRRQG